MTLTIWRQHQSVRMSKITNDSLTRSCTGCFIAIWQMCWPSLSEAGRRHRHLHSANRGHLVVPRYRLTTAGRRAFSCAGPSAWNSLPEYLTVDTLTLDYFKRSLKCFLFARYWHSAWSALGMCNDSALYKCTLNNNNNNNNNSKNGRQMVRDQWHRDLWAGGSYDEGQNKVRVESRRPKVPGYKGHATDSLHRNKVWEKFSIQVGGDMHSHEFLLVVSSV